MKICPFVSVTLFNWSASGNPVTHRYIVDPDFGIKGWLDESTEAGRKETEMMIGPVVKTCIALLKSCGSEEEKEFLVPKLEKFDLVTPYVSGWEFTKLLKENSQDFRNFEMLLRGSYS